MYLVLFQSICLDIYIYIYIEREREREREREVQKSGLKVTKVDKVPKGRVFDLKGAY